MSNVVYAILLTACVAFSHATGPPLILHEKREPNSAVVPSRSRIDPDTILPMRIGLQQNQNALEAAERWLMDVSDPDSPNYGQHWTQKDVIAAFQPSAQTIRTATEWLNSHNISEFIHSDNRLWFAFDLPASKAEKMLQTEYFEHPTADSLGFEASCDEYYLPEGMKDHIDYIVPGVKGGDITGRTERSRSFLNSFVPSHRKGRSDSEQLAERSSDVPANKDDLANCGVRATPACIRALYNIPLADPNRPISPNNSLGIFEALHILYYQPALNKFYQKWTDVPVGTEPIFVPVGECKKSEDPFQTIHYTTSSNAPADVLPMNLLDGGSYPSIQAHGAPPFLDSEAEGDVEIAQPIVYPQNLTVWDMSDKHNRSNTLNFNYYNRILDAFDGSYCTYEERVNSSKGGKPKCGVYTPTNVISYSWSYAELLIPSLFWKKRQCMEYLKLGLQGVSMFFSSGDNGVSYFSNHFPPCKNGTNDFRVFDPSFPSDCPWVTAVGATQIAPGKTVFDREIGVRWHEVGSGGGFGNTFDRPLYQDAAVEHFFKTTNSTIPYYYNGDYQNGTGSYNRNGRGIPDISAIGKHVAIEQHPGPRRFGGTSAGAPLVAAIFNRIVEERIRAGKGRVGFVNPTLYKNAEAMTDILVGQNGQCGPNTGFYCTPGWDPVTGLGTPDYEKLLAIFMKLP